MATPATGARASRRSAATRARQTIVEGAVPAAPVQPPVSAAPPVEVEEPDMDALADEAFGPDEVAAPQAPTKERPQFHTQAQSTPLPMATPPSVTYSAPLAIPQEDLTRKIDVGDLIIPKLRLTQAMSKTNMLYQTTRGKEGVQQGNWCHSVTGENLGETVYFIPVDMRKSRALFIQGSGLTCRSFDLLNGEGDPGGACEGSYEERMTMPADRRGCPLRLWNDNQPPKCGVTYNFPGLVIRETEIDDPSKAKPIQAILQLRSASTSAAKAINTFMVNEGGGVWHNLILELGVEVKTNTRGTFYVPTVDFYDTTDAEGFERILRRASSMARQMGNTNLRSSIESDDNS